MAALPERPEEGGDEVEQYNPYANWRSRCEPVPGARTCETSTDCEKVKHPAGAALECVMPWWSNDTKVCSPGWSTRTEQAWRRERLREIVRVQYFDEVTLCPDEEKPSWKCQRERQRAETLTKFLWLVYQRETTGRPWKRHMLEGDVRLAKTTWFSSAPRYGWWGEEDKHGNVTMAPCSAVPELDGEPRTLSACRAMPPSKHYDEQPRWVFGLGPYGQIAPLWVAAWDPLAPPEILCGEVEPTEAYLRRARGDLVKFMGGFQCAGEVYKPQPTWDDLHRAVAAGKLCPDGRERSRFRARAERLGLDPDQVVSLSMLGRPIEPANQNERVAEIVAQLPGRPETVQRVEL